LNTAWSVGKLGIIPRLVIASESPYQVDGRRISIRAALQRRSDQQG
jgi:hypothetical protein